MCNYLIGRGANPKTTYHYSLESIQKAGGVLTPLTASNLKLYGEESGGKYFDFEALQPYADRLFYSEIYRNPTLLLDKTRPLFNINGNETIFITEGISDVLSCLTNQFDKDYGVLFRYNLTSLPDLPNGIKRVIFIRDNDETVEELLKRISNQYNHRLFREVAFYTFGMDKTGFKDISVFNDHSEIETNEELIRYIVTNSIHLNKELFKVSNKLFEVA